MKKAPISLYPLALALFALALPSASEAASFVKSVEYVELPMAAGATTVSGNLTKGQVLANCVPFASASTSSGIPR